MHYNKRFGHENTTMVLQKGLPTTFLSNSEAKQTKRFSFVVGAKAAVDG